MTISEKSAYLKGLMDGMKLDTESDTGKMIAAIVDLLGDVTRTLTDVEETTIAISDELDEIEEDLDAIEDYLLDDEDEDDDFDFGFFGEDDFEDDFADDDDDDDEDDDDEDDDEDEDDEDGDDELFLDFDLGGQETIYEVECSCGNIIDFDEETLNSGSIVCPNCGEVLEFTTEEE